MNEVLNLAGHLRASRAELFDALQPEEISGPHLFVLAEVMAASKSLRPACCAMTRLSSKGWKRQNRSAQEAVQDLTFELQYGCYGYVVEADIRGFFDNMDHDQLCQMLEQRIDDQAFLGLIRQWLKAGILETDGGILHPQTGTPQGGIVSPILANVHLHHVLDRWFHEVVQSHCQGEAMLVRYADDWVCAFRYQKGCAAFLSRVTKAAG